MKWLRIPASCASVHRSPAEPLSQHRFTDEEGRIEVYDTIGGPAVVSLRAVEEDNNRPVSMIENIAAKACSSQSLPPIA